MNLGQIVQFLERQKHDIAGEAELITKQEIEKEEEQKESKGK